MTNERIVHCPKCGELLRRIGGLAEPYKKCMGILEYDMYCGKCDTTVTIEDSSSFEQDDKTMIMFT